MKTQLLFLDFIKFRGWVGKRRYSGCYTFKWLVAFNWTPKLTEIEIGSNIYWWCRQAILWSAVLVISKATLQQVRVAVWGARLGRRAGRSRRRPVSDQILCEWIIFCGLSRYLFITKDLSFNFNPPEPSGPLGKQALWPTARGNRRPRIWSADHIVIC